jgi:hypothetical protein
MAIAATRALELEQAPILGVRDLKVHVAPVGNQLAFIHVGIELFNAGRVPVRYHVRSMRLTFANRSTEPEQFLSSGGTVLPGSSVIFWHTGMLLDPPVATFPAIGRVRCELDYARAAASEREVLVTTIEFRLSDPTPGKPLFWLYVEEPV